MVVATIVLLAAIAPFVVFAVPQVIGADDGFVVLSGSMEPAMSPGDVVIVDASTSIAPGDVITYGRTADGVPTTHRVVGVLAEGYETKGDANENVDAGVVSPDSVVGEVVLVIPFIGHVILWANTPTGYVALVVVPLLLLGANELWRYARPSPSDGQTASAEAPERTDEAEFVTKAPVDDDALGGDATADRTGIDDEASADASSATAEASVTATTRSGHDELPSVFAAPASEPAPIVESASGPNEPTVGVGVLDMKLTMLAMAVVLAYALWNVWRELAAFDAPSPVSVGVLTGALLGLTFATWVTVAAWRQNRQAVPAHAPVEPTAHRTDGGADMENEDE